MAQKVVHSLVSDLSGTEDGVSNVEFSLDGVDYEIDLTSPEQAKLRDSLAEYIEHARRTGRNRSRASSPGKRTGAALTRHSANTRPERGRSKEIREWARGKGYELSNRGRIPAEVTEAYDAAH